MFGSSYLNHLDMNTRFKAFASCNIFQYLCDFIHVLIFVTVSKCRKSQINEYSEFLSSNGGGGFQVVARDGVKKKHSFQRCILHVWCETQRTAEIMETKYKGTATRFTQYLCRALGWQESSDMNQWSEIFWGIIGWDPSICRSNRLRHVDILRFYFL